MPMIMIETAVLTTVTVANAVAGSAFEFARQRQVVSMGWVQSATGGFFTLQAGSDVIAEEFMGPILTTYPIIPDNMYFTDIMEPGDRLVVRYRNPTGGTLTIRGVVQTSPI